MSDANTTSLAYSIEDSFGVLPASPQFTLLRQTSESLQFQKNTVQSAEVRADRHTSDLAKVGGSASGAINFELSATSYDDFITGALCAAPVAVSVTTSGSATITASTGVLLDAPATFDNVPIGAWVKITGAAVAGNNGVKLVINKAGNGSSLTFHTGAFVSNETIAITVTAAKVWRVGTSKRFYTLERGVLCGADRYFQRFSGMLVNQMSLNMTTEQIITGSFDFIGKEGVVGDTSLDPTGIAVTAATSTATHLTYTVASHSFVVGNVVSVEGITPSAYNGEFTVTSTTGTTVVVASTANPAAGSVFGTIRLATPASYTAAPTTPVMKGSCATGAIYRGNALSSVPFKTVNWTLNNNARGLTKLFDCGNFDVGLGSAQITGTLQAYFRDNALLADLIAHTYAGIAYYVQDSDGKVIGVNFPKANFSTGTSPVTGLNTDVMVDLGFQAILDSTSGTSMVLSYIA